MISKNKSTLLLLLLSLVTSLSAQYAPGVDWKTIDTEHFQIIFPEEITEQALVLAGKIDLIYEAESMDFAGVRMSKWPVVLTNSSMEANGYVALAPRKSVWYSSPIVEEYTALEWYDLLGLHETRHMVQYDRLNSRLIHLLYLLSGQNGVNLGIAFGVPDWYFEGDAVATETLYSESGRGRDPLFYRGMRDVVTNQYFSYSKMVNGSYRDWVPDHYELGYFLTSYVKNTYGEDSFDRILKAPALLPFPSFGMYLGSKKITGLSWSQLYEKMAEDLKNQWEEQAKRVELTDNTALTSESGDRVVQWEPVSIENNRILARRISLSEPAALVRITEEGTEDVMRVPGYGSITIRGDKAAWSVIRPSLHHTDQSWSDIITVNLETGTGKDLTKKKRFMMPSYNHAGDTIAVVEWNRERTGSIVLLDDTTGQETGRFPVDKGLFPANPAWSGDDRTLYFTVQGHEGRAIAGIPLDTGEMFLLTDFSMEKIKNLHPWEQYVLYSSDLSGLENVMAVDTLTGKKYQVSSRLNGVVKPMAGTFGDKEILLYGEYITGSSRNLAVQDLDNSAWIPEEDIKPLSFVYYGEDNVTQGSAGWDLDRFTEEARSYSLDDIRDYSLFKGDFNVHSWGLGSETSDTEISLQVESADLMGTMNWTLGGAYNTNEKSSGAFLNLEWTQFYPEISSKNEYWYREIDSVDCHDLSSAVSVSFPLNVSRGFWVNEITPSAGLGIDAVVNPDNTADPERDIPVHYGLEWSAYLPGSYQSLLPLWGAGQTFYFEHNPQQDEDHFFSGSSTFYLPGGLRNTGLSLSAAYENQTGGYSSRVLFSRGYEAAEKEQLYQFRGNYAFPIAYPDAAVGSYFYFKRLRGKLFYDYTVLYDKWPDQSSYQSVGAELNLDFTALNVKNLPLSMGLRFSWLIEEEKPQIEFLLLDAAL